MKQQKKNNQVSDLTKPEIYESVEDAPSFLEWAKQQQEREKLGLKPNLTKMKEKQIESVPKIAPFSELEIYATDDKGNKHLIGAMDKGLIKEKNRDVKIKPKNYSLKRLANVSNSKLYYNIEYGDFWLEVYNYGKPNRKITSIKLENHDIQTLKAFAIAHARDFCLPVPKQIWIGKKLRKKIQKICEIFHKEVFPTHEELSRKNQCFGKL